jgi:hypothetical protein
MLRFCASILVWLAVFAAYMGLRRLRPDLDLNENVQIARAWIAGHGYIDSTPFHEQVKINGHFYAIRPILSAAVCVPFVLAGVYQQSTVACVLGATAAWLVYQLTSSLWLVVFFAFGTTVFFEATYGSVWGFDVLLACTMALLALVELRRARPWGLLVGLWAGMMALARYDTAPAILAYGWLLSQRTNRRFWFRIGVLACFGVYVYANEIRWGIWYDPTLILMHDVNRTPGPVFGLRYLPSNLFIALLNGPQQADRFPWFVPSYYGEALILLSPALIGALRPSLHWPKVQGLWLAIILSMGPSMLWYWTGISQYGARYWVQSFPFFIELIALGEIDQCEKILIGASVASTMLGFYSIMTQGWLR